MTILNRKNLINYNSGKNTIKKRKNRNKDKSDRGNQKKDSSGKEQSEKDRYEQEI